MYDKQFYKKYHITFSPGGGDGSGGDDSCDVKPKDG